MDIIKDYLPWIMSGITIYTMVLAGRKSNHTWLIGLSNQALWLTWILVTGTWGLIPMNLALWVVYFRNHFQWNEPKPQVFSPAVLEAHAQYGGDLVTMQAAYDRGNQG